MACRKPYQTILDDTEFLKCERFAHLLLETVNIIDSYEQIFFFNNLIINLS